MLEGTNQKNEGMCSLMIFFHRQMFENSSGSSFQGDTELFRSNKKEEKLL